MTSYPWSNLVESKQQHDLPLDEDDLLAENTALKTANEKLKEDCEIYEKQIQEIKETLQQVQIVSNQTFDKLNRHNEDISQLLATRTQELAKMTQKIIDKQHEELVYPIIVQAIISQRAGLIGEAKIKRTTEAMLRWMTQRVNVIKYLRERNLYPRVVEYLESVLFIESDDLVSKIDSLVV